MQESLADLKKFDCDWNDFSVNKKIKTDEIPEGEYDVEIENVFVGKTGSEKTCVKWKLKIIEGDYLGRKLWKTTVLSSKENIKWLKYEMSICGLEIEKLIDLASECSKLNGTKVKIRTKSSGKFTNVYIDEKVS